MRKGDAARQELIARAAELFDSRGYEAVSVKDIADALGWAKSLFYYYCPSKEQLVLLAAEHKVEMLLEGLNAGLERCPNNVERLNLALGRAVFFLKPDAAEGAAVVSELYSPLNFPWRAQLRACLTRRMAEGVDKILALGAENYEMFIPVREGLGAALLDMAGSLGDRAAEALRIGSAESISHACSIAHTYCRVIERLIDAPYGSISLIDADYIARVASAMGIAAPGEKAGS